jgi:integrase
VSEDYFKHEGNSLRTGRRRKLDVDRLVMNTPLGARRIHDITRSEIVALLDCVKKRNGKSMAGHILSYLRRILNWHQARDETYRSPIVPGMLGKRKARQNRRKRVLSDIELNAVWHAAEGLRLKDTPKSREPVALKIFAGLVQFLLLTACRRQEGARGARHEIHGDVFLIPPEGYKTDMHLAVPLSAAAQGLLASLPKINKKWVFATRNGKRPFGGFSNAKKEFDKAVLQALRKENPGAVMERWTIHDLRRTARTLLSRAKVPYDIAERCIGHTRGEMDETYNMYAHLDEKRAAFEALANMIAQIVGEEVDDLDRSVDPYRLGEGGLHQ